MQISDSKYLTLLILSYVDMAPLVCIKYLSRLNKRYSEYARNRQEESLNVLVKENKTFILREEGQVKSISQINLLNYQFNLSITARLMP